MSMGFLVEESQAFMWRGLMVRYKRDAMFIYSLLLRLLLVTNSALLRLLVTNSEFFVVV